MNILFYAGGSVAEALQRVIDKPTFAIEVYRTIADLKDRFRYPLDDPTIAVLVAHTRQCLEELLSIRNLLGNVRIILLLPDREPETVARGHDLHARFLTYLDGDPGEVAMVLSRMAERAGAMPRR